MEGRKSKIRGIKKEKGGEKRERGIKKKEQEVERRKKWGCERLRTEEMEKCREHRTKEKRK